MAKVERDDPRFRLGDVQEITAILTVMMGSVEARSTVKSGPGRCGIAGRGDLFIGWQLLFHVEIALPASIGATEKQAFDEVDRCGAVLCCQCTARDHRDVRHLGSISNRVRRNDDARIPRIDTGMPTNCPRTGRGRLIGIGSAGGTSPGWTGRRTSRRLVATNDPPRYCCAGNFGRTAPAGAVKVSGWFLSADDGHHQPGRRTSPGHPAAVLLGVPRRHR